LASEPVIDMERRLKAGREYHTALRRLGFDPDALLWAGVGGSDADGAMELLIVTTWADNIGPKAIYDLLFEAYDASATPKEIDPFIVSLFSPQSRVAIDLAAAVYTVRKEVHRADFTPMLVLGMMDYVTIPEWIISYRQPKSTRFDDARRFRAFQTNVEKLAA